MTIGSKILAGVGFVLSLPFALAWVILAMIRGRHDEDAQQTEPLDADAKPVSTRLGTRLGWRIKPAASVTVTDSGAGVPTRPPTSGASTL